MKKRFFRMGEKSGFTIIELLIITVIVAMVSTVAVISAVKYRSAQDLRLSINEFAALVRDVQRKSVTQEDGKRWGVRFENTESGKDRIYIFKGTSYASGTVTQSVLVRRGVQFGEPSASSTRDVVFTPIDGGLAPNKVITLNTGLNDGLFGDIIMSALGRVTTRIDNGIAGYWHLDEGVGTSTTDASGRGSNGSFVGSPTWLSGTSCKAGGCLSFSGTGQHVDLGTGSNLDYSGAITILAWAKATNSAGGPYTIFAKDNNRYVLEVFEHAVYVTITSGNDDWVGSASVINDTDWHHYGFTYDETSQLVAIYVDGVLVGSATKSWASDNVGSVYIGSRDGSFNWAGTIDETRLYDRALSAQEIASIYEDLK